MYSVGCPAILFVCTANQSRSPIAAATYKQVWSTLRPDQVCRVASAGTWTRSGVAITGKPLRLAKEVGIDLSGFTTTSIEDIRLPDYDIVAVMEIGHQEALVIEHPEIRKKIHLLPVLAGAAISEIPDPVDLEFSKAVRVLKVMQDMVRKLAQRMAMEYGE